MPNWDHYRFFLAIQRHNSLKEAGKALGVNQSTVGRTLTSLEENLGAKLFERRSNGFILTAAGERIVETLASVDSSMHHIERLLAGEDERPEGKVKIAMPGAIANHWFIPHLKDFYQKHPRLELEFLTGPEILNLSRREADLALRLVKPEQKELMVKKMGTLRLHFAGHTSLFNEAPAPVKADDLAMYPFVGLYEYATSKAERRLLSSQQDFINVSLRSAAWSSVYAAVSAGIGIGILPSFMIEQNPQIRTVLPDLKSSMPLWLAYHPDLRQSMRVRAVINYLQTLLKKDL